jgi:hypothetical protein
LARLQLFIIACSLSIHIYIHFTTLKIKIFLNCFALAVKKFLWRKISLQCQVIKETFSSSFSAPFVNNKIISSVGDKSL